MIGYRAPLRDMRFVWNELLDFESLRGLFPEAELSPDLADAVLAEAARLCETRLFSLNRGGDEEGCRFDEGRVVMPQGFDAAYRAFAEGGWTGLACDPAFGGQGLPRTLAVLVEEMLCSANLAFGVLPGLSHGAYTALAAHGSDELKRRFLPPLVSGRWSGTMCLTEPQCGTDLGLLRTRAAPDGEGAYRLTGTKIFISAGEHELTENILHLVLARLPDAPPGIKGISLFLVPKFLCDAEGRLGARNGVSCGGIEHKMGLKASPTCVLNFDEAVGYLVGQPHKGLRAMFTMMNEERVSVGIQGLGLGEASYQGAVAYARERLQGRKPGGPLRLDLPADPIIDHPDVRRMLISMRAWNEGARMLAGWVSWHLDRAARHPDPQARQEAEEFVSLLTPVVKAFLTDRGFEVVNLGVQVWGGHGYIRENGMEQYVRDARIAQIYEGTNGIQALDLVGRKLPAHTGRLLRRFFHPVDSFLAERGEDAALAEFTQPLAKAFARLRQATLFIAAQGLKSPAEAAAAASDYLHLFGLVAQAYLWARAAALALERQSGEDATFYAAKLATARFFMARLLPASGALLAAILSGGGVVMGLDEAAF